MIISIDMIEPGTRLRGADPEHVATLAASIGEVGMLSPITVYRRQIVRQNIAVDGWGLIAGLHRMEACRSLGHADIDAAVVELPELKRQLAECDENLCGAKLSPSERALFTRRRKEIYEALHPETRHGGDRASRKVCDLNERFSADTASHTGRSERAVQLDATRGARIAEDVLDQVRGTDLDKGVVLDKLARIDPDQQREAIRQMAEAPRVKPAPAPLNAFETEEHWMTAIMRVWNRGAQEWRERFLETVDTPAFDRTRAGAA